MSEPTTYLVVLRITTDSPYSDPAEWDFRELLEEPHVVLEYSGHIQEAPSARIMEVLS